MLMLAGKTIHQSGFYILQFKHAIGYVIYMI